MLYAEAKELVHETVLRLFELMSASIRTVLQTSDLRLDHSRTLCPHAVHHIDDADCIHWGARANNVTQMVHCNVNPDERPRPTDTGADGNASQMRITLPAPYVPAVYDDGPG